MLKSRCHRRVPLGHLWKKLLPAPPSCARDPVPRSCRTEGPSLQAVARSCPLLLQLREASEGRWGPSCTLSLPDFPSCSGDAREIPLLLMVHVTPWGHLVTQDTPPHSVCGLNHICKVPLPCHITRHIFQALGVGASATFLRTGRWPCEPAMEGPRAALGGGGLCATHPRPCSGQRCPPGAACGRT